MFILLSNISFLENGTRFPAEIIHVALTAVITYAIRLERNLLSQPLQFSLITPVLANLEPEVGSETSRVRSDIEHIGDSRGGAVLPCSHDAVRCDNFIDARWSE